MPAGDFTVCLMTLRQSVWGKGHFRELRDPAILHSEISGTGLKLFAAYFFSHGLARGWRGEGVWY